MSRQNVRQREALRAAVDRKPELKTVVVLEAWKVAAVVMLLLVVSFIAGLTF